MNWSVQKLAFCLSLTFVVSLKTMAIDNVSNRRLFFPFEKNNVQILPQRFEYELVDKDIFRIGNAYFDAQLFSFKMNDVDEQEDLQKISLQWPASLLASGEISIRDNIGKSVWTYPFNKSAVKLTRKKTQAGSTIVASFSGKYFPTEVFKLIQYSPYFKLCIQKTELFSRIALCSKDFFFVKGDKGQYRIQPRDQTQQKSFVNINGQDVDSTGVIFLQGSETLLSVRTLLLSGASVDVDTRMKMVDFRDIYQAPNGEGMVITASGAEPTSGSKHTRLENGNWQMTLNPTRPIIYLKGEGEIPLRQEFIIQGPVRNQGMNVESPSHLPLFTYSKSVNIKLEKPKGYTLTKIDDQTELTEDGDYYLWTLNNLNESSKNRRQIKVGNQSESLVAAWEIEKASAWLGRFILAFPFSAGAQVERWFDNKFLGIGFEFDHYFTGMNSEDKSAQRLRLPIYLSFRKFINLKDPTWGLLAVPQQNTIGIQASQSVMLGFFSQIRIPESLSYLGKWNRTELEAASFSLGDPSFNKAQMLRTEFYYELSPAQYWQWGLEWRHGRMSNTERYSRRLGINLGLILRF